MTDALAALAPHFFQVAYVVRDLPAAEEWFKKVWGVPLFVRSENMSFPATSTYRGKPSVSSMSLSLGFARETNVELIQPLTGPSLYTDFLDAKGPGLHHVAFSVPDFAGAVAGLKAQGLEALLEGHLDSGTDFAYFDCEAAGASVIEILGFPEATLQFLDRLKSGNLG